MKKYGVFLPFFQKILEAFYNLHWTSFKENQTHWFPTSNFDGGGGSI